MATTIKSEEQLQTECFTWYWNMYRFTSWKRMLHCNNNNSHNRIAGNRNKAMGVVAGVSDMELICLDGRMIFIEFKIPGGTLSDEQKEFASEVQARGHSYVVIFSLAEFKELIWAVIGK